MSTSSPHRPEDDADEAQEGPRKRVRHWTKSDRESHSMIEKARRAQFKESLMNLASLLPGLDEAKPSQLSKHVIVERSINHFSDQEKLIQSLSMKLEQVTAERDQMAAELNALRQSASMQGRPASSIPPPSNVSPPNPMPGPSLHQSLESQMPPSVASYGAVPMTNLQPSAADSGMSDFDFDPNFPVSNPNVLHLANSATVPTAGYDIFAHETAQSGEVNAFSHGSDRPGPPQHSLAYSVWNVPII